MSEYLWYAVVILAAWRLTSILQRERIARPIRRFFGERDDKATGLYTYPDSFFGYLISCFYCISVWTALFCYIVFLVFPYLLLPLAISAAAIITEERAV